MSQIQYFMLRLLVTALIVTAGLTGSRVCAQTQRDETPDSRNGTFSDRRQLPVDPIVLTPVAWSVIADPVVPVRGTDGRVHLAYVLLFTSLSTERARITSIEVVDPLRNNRVVGTSRVVTVEDDDVTTKFKLLALKQPTITKAGYSDWLRPARSAFLYLDVTFDDLRDVPRQIKHRVTVSQTDAQNKPVLITGIGGLTEVSRREAVVLSPPLKGDRWMNVNGCCEIIGPHRSAILPLNGTLRPAQQFAIDFMQLDAQGRLYTGDPKDLNNWHYYGTQVVAAAGGRVVKVVNDLPNQVPFETPLGITGETIAGNQVIIDMGEGRYALYAHMIPGSVVVSEGQLVERGQLLGRLGNSGNTDAPHLHFHVMDRPSALDANGLPFVFDRMEFQGRTVGTLNGVLGEIFDGGAAQINPAGGGRRRREMPLTLDVVGFK
ncbi:MAG: M23 family metallopeptidase [Acidobacteriota bacterium]|nr:M23 family metallopeptidase [Acidobacteriota bacterium]